MSNGDELDDEEMGLQNKLNPICGCANGPALRVLRDCMRVMQDKGDHNAPGWYERLCQRQVEATGGGSWEIVMHLLDQLGWNEHGGSINASWLTPTGEAALVALTRLLEIEEIRERREENEQPPLAPTDNT